MNTDKELEKKRYDFKVKKLLQNNQKLEKQKLYGATSIKLFLRKPYLVYEDLILKNIKKKSKVIEIGSGIGGHSEILLQTNADITLSDISVDSLNVLQNVFHKNYKNFNILSADMENIPVKDNTFDFVVSAGSMSYGNKEILQKEIYRILKPEGYLIVVDSLNDNLIYRINRYFNYLGGKRSKSTLLNMMNLNDIMKYESQFKIKKLYFYGSIIWLEPLLRVILSKIMINRVISYFDKFINVKKSAFKFVVMMKKNS
ncbi:class I SAM-dependent methyltransferase [Pelagibacteraceae bacterium]|nr:class I SAM-dependent methyltransferase [Pelagibacteraceae bacterium]